MSQIRSALEIALEKTADIHGDPSAGKTRELKNAGKKAAGEFVETGDISVLKKTVESYSPDDRGEVIGGAASLLLTQISLPDTEKSLEKTDRIIAALDALVPGKGITQFGAQIQEVFRQYLSGMEHIEKSLVQQFMPKLRAKEKELSQRYGQEIHIQPSQDPEFATLLSRNMAALKEQYGQAVDEARAHISSLAGLN